MVEHACLSGGSVPWTPPISPASGGCDMLPQTEAHDANKTVQCLGLAQRSAAASQAYSELRIRNLGIDDG